MQAVFALAFLALANAAIIDPIYNYKPEAKYYNPYTGYDFTDKYLNEAVFSAPIADAVIASAAPGVAPISYAKSASPLANIISGASPLVSSAIPLEAAYASALKSGFAHAIPAVKSAAYHLVKADYPYFTAAPTSSYVEAANPVTAEEIAARGLIPALTGAFPATAASLAAADPALRAYAPAGAVHAAAPATHFIAVPSPAASGFDMFKSAAVPWGLVSNIAAPSSVISAASAPTSLVRVASPLMLGAESAFAPASAFAAAPAFATAPHHLVKAAPASFAHGLFGAESALTGFAPAGTPMTLVKVISPASSLFGAENTIAFAPAHAGHAHAFSPALMKAAFPFTAASVASDALTYARAMPTLAGVDAATLSAFAPAGLSAISAPATGYLSLADAPALKNWIK